MYLWISITIGSCFSRKEAFYATAQAAEPVRNYTKHFAKCTFVKQISSKDYVKGWARFIYCVSKRTLWVGLENGQFLLTNVCFKKTVTIHSTVSQLWIVTVFLKQTLITVFPRIVSSLEYFPPLNSLRSQNLLLFNSFLPWIVSSLE